jgi:hypothetical protein
VIIAFFEEQRPKEREEKRSQYASAVVSNQAERYRDCLDKWRNAEKPLAPFHWEVELPEVFERESTGFDAIVGNPPFAGVTTLSENSVGWYTAWLRNAWPGSGGKCDLVAFFFRQAWLLIRDHGTLGLIATNTVAEGDTRRSGLEVILREGGVIFDAYRSIKWPGQANVYISRVCIRRGPVESKRLNGKPAKNINMFLLDAPNNQEPIALAANASKAFLGCKPGAKWHVVGDSEKGYFPAARVSVVREECPELIRTYIGGAELYSEPSAKTTRQIIVLGLLETDQVVAFPRTLRLLAQLAGKNPETSSMWWRFARRAVELYSKLPRFNTVLVRAEVSDTFAFERQSAEAIFSNKCVVFLLDDWGSFSILQSRTHECWARLTSSTQGEGLSYVPKCSFETFPFPNNWLNDPKLEAAGKAYYQFRVALMIKNDEGLTKTYNRFHDPDEHDLEIKKLRELHTIMDRAVLDAYGWSEIKTDCEFFLDYDIDEEEWGDRKKPYRYRWPDEVRDEVLARLLALNAERAKEEVRSGASTVRKGGGNKAAPKCSPKASETEDLFS